MKLSPTIATAFGGVRIPIGSPNLQLYGTLGARYFNDGVAITLRTPVVGFEHHTSANRDWIDPVIGVAAHYRVNDKWFVNAQADIGGLDNSATSQALGSIGYNWTQNISTTLGYRVMYGYDKDENARGGSVRLQQWIYGPFAGFKYSFSRVCRFASSQGLFVRSAGWPHRPPDHAYGTKRCVRRIGARIGDALLRRWPLTFGLPQPVPLSVGPALWKKALIRGAALGLQLGVTNPDFVG